MEKSGKKKNCSMLFQSFIRIDEKHRKISESFGKYASEYRFLILTCFSPTPS